MSITINHQTNSITSNTGITTSVIAAPAGTLAAPSYSVSGDSNTGIYFPATGTIGVVRDGVEAVRFDSSGRLGLGGTQTADSIFAGFYNKTPITGAVSASANYSNGVVESNVTTSASYYETNANTQAASFTLANFYHYEATQSTLGAGSAVTTQYGFAVDSSLIGATNNYGFRGGISSGSGRWNLYMDGTANNYFAGSLRIGDVTGVGAAPLALVSDGTNNNGNIGMRRSSNDATAPILLIGKARGTPAVPVQVNASDALGSINFQGYIGSAFTTAASITCGVEGTPGTGDLPTTLIFSTSRDGAASPVERMRIGNSGRIAIGPINSQGEALGTTAPARLFVNNTQYTDIATPASTTVAYAPFTSFGTPILAATNTAVTYTNAATVYIENAPSAGANVTITNPHALVVNGGATYFGGTVTIVGTTTVNGPIFSRDVIGYASGNGGEVTQTTSRTTGITLNKSSGAITLVSAAGTATWQSFTVTNNKVIATDIILVNQKSGTDKYIIHVTNVNTGTFEITFSTTGGTTTEQPVFNFAVIKAVTS